jgi:hypothetical protein
VADGLSECPPPGRRVEEWAVGRPDAVPIAIHVCQHSSPWQLEAFPKKLNESLFLKYFEQC